MPASFFIWGCLLCDSPLGSGQPTNFGVAGLSGRDPGSIDARAEPDETTPSPSDGQFSKTASLNNPAASTKRAPEVEAPKKAEVTPESTESPDSPDYPESLAREEAPEAKVPGKQRAAEAPGPSTEGGSVGVDSRASPPTKARNQTRDPEQKPRYRTVVKHGTGRDGQARREAVARKTPGFASAISVDEERAAHPADLPELISRTPAATTRSIGGLGQFSALSLRGSSTQQVRVFVDGVPVDGSFSGLANLSQNSLSSLSHVEIFRGYIPIEYGGATMGGALALFSRVHPFDEPAKLSARVGVGSFGARAFGGNVGFSLGSRRSIILVADYQGADGDYPFFSNNGTFFNRDDDRTEIRQNNGFDRYQIHVGIARKNNGPKTWEAQSFVRFVQEMLQIPGMGRVQSTESQQNLWNLRIHSRQGRRFSAPGSHLRIVGSIAREKRHFLDPKGEVGLGRDDEYADTADGYLGATLRWPLWPFGFLGAGLDQRLEGVLVDRLRERPENAVRPSPGDATRLRWSSGASLQLEQYLAKGRILLQPAVRADFVRSLFSIPENVRPLGDEGKDHTQWGISPRLGARIRLLEPLEMRGSAGRYLRLPTLMELFGDRGYIVGNEALVAERGTSLDIGLRWLHKGAVRTEIASAYFASWPRELIMWQRAGSHVRAVNLRAATVQGVENEVHLEAWNARIRFDGSYTWLDTKNKSPEPSQADRPLPGRPEHQLFSKLRFGSPVYTKNAERLAWEGFGTYEWISGNFLDPSGRYEIPSRSIWGIGASLGYQKWHLDLALRNLADKRSAEIEAIAGPTPRYPAAIADYLGYPLPGRSLWVSLRFDAELMARKNAKR